MDSSKEDIAAYEKGDKSRTHKTHHLMPVVNQAKDDAIGEVKKGDMPEGEKAAYRRLREARSEARLVGVREKRAKAKAEEKDTAKK